MEQIQVRVLGANCSVLVPLSPHLLSAAVVVFVAIAVQPITCQTASHPFYHLLQEVSCSESWTYSNSAYIPFSL